MGGKKQRKKFNKEVHAIEHIEQDEYFYFIAGYTDGGVPYGLTWEEYEAEQSCVSKNFGGDCMLELKLTEQQLQEIVEIYDIYVDEIEYFLNIETGDVVMLRGFDMDEEEEQLSEAIDDGFNEIYFRFPHRASDEGYVDMVEFAETVSDEKLRARLLNEIRNRERVMEWLESINVSVIIV